MAYREKIPPAGHSQGYKSAFWLRAEWVVCPTCGAKFFRTHNKTMYCSKQCDGSRLTQSQRVTVNIFMETCHRYKVSVEKTFVMLCHTTRRQWHRFTRTETQGHIGKASKDRYIMSLKKFLIDLHAGWYDIVQMGKANSFRRRMTPGQPNCPMKHPTCRGALFTPDCPRSLRDCPLSGF